MKARWQHPKVLPIDQVSEVWGTCLDGSTPTDTTCENGQTTAVGGYEDPHGCLDGGIASQEPGCSTGTQVTPI